MVNQIVGYHVTSRKKLKNILDHGLKTRIPEDYGDSGDIKGIYLFKTLDDVENALSNWLGERINEIEEESGEPYDEVILKINLTDLEEFLIDSVEYEWICIVPIGKNRILKAFTL